MKVRDLRQIVDRTTQEMAASLPGLRGREFVKPRDLNSPAKLALRRRALSETVLRPSKSEKERILGDNDLVDLNFFERGLFAAKSVCRVILRDEAERQIGAASGFLVSPALLLTNHHVFPHAGEAALALAQFDYELDIEGIERRGPSFRTRPDIYFFAHEELDFAIVAVDQSPDGDQGDAGLTTYRYLRLNPNHGKINEGEFISIIQHPSGLPKQVALRENKLLKKEDNFLVYHSDTAQGSSGSPLFNDTWQVVGLHSAGVPRKNAKGQWLTKAGTIADNSTDDGEIDWIGNRGIRASRIVAALGEAPASPVLDEFMAIANGEVAPPALFSPAGPRTAESGTSRFSKLRVTATVDGTRIDLPIGYAAEIEQVGTNAPPTPTAPADGSNVMAATEAYKAPVIDEKYENRKGYDKNFLSEVITLPRVTKTSLAAKMTGGGTAIPYEHFSIVMHKARRLAMFTACNVDATEKARRPDPSKSYSRKSLGGLADGDIEKWVPEERIDAKHQLPDAFFKNDRKSFDKGHIVRRDDVVWGKSYAQVQRANGDSYHVTNCSPQVAAFNQSKLGGDWGRLENMILKQAKGERVVVFAGPVFDDAKDRPFKGKDEDGNELVVKIPSQFWKIVVADGTHGLEAYGFVLKQDLKAVDWEFKVDSEWVEELTSLKDIQALADFIRIPKNVMRADMHGRIEPQESLAVNEIVRRPSASRSRRRG
jgi:endonuclease G